MSILNKIRHKIISEFRSVLWYIDYYHERGRINSIKTKCGLSPQGVKLIIVPHVDDEWIGCSQVLMRFPNSVICDLDMPGGDSTIIHEKRKTELLNAAKYLKRNILNIGFDKSKRLESVIREWDCTELFIPFFIDWHPEHLEVNHIIEEAIKNLDKNITIYKYQVSVPIRLCDVNEVLAMTKRDSQNKWLLFKRFYRTQLHLPVKRFILQERINGAFSDSYSAEVFCRMDREEWLAVKSKYQLTDLQRKELLKGLNNIGKTRENVERILKTE